MNEERWFKHPDVTDEQRAEVRDLVTKGKERLTWLEQQVQGYALAMLRFGKPIYRDTVRPGVIATRRRRNRSARKARRLNR